MQTEWKNNSYLDSTLLSDNIYITNIFIGVILWNQSHHLIFSYLVFLQHVQCSRNSIKSECIKGKVKTSGNGFKSQGKRPAVWKLLPITLTNIKAGKMNRLIRTGKNKAFYNLIVSTLSIIWLFIWWRNILNSWQNWNLHKQIIICTFDYLLNFFILFFSF